MRIKALMFVLMSVAGMCLSPARATVITPATRDSLETALKTNKTAADSVKTLYNLYDVIQETSADRLGRNDRAAFLEQLYYTAGRAGKTAVQLDALRNLANIYRTDSIKIQSLLNRVRSLPASPDRQETEIFIKIQKNAWSVRDTAATAEKRKKVLLDSARDYLQLTEHSTVYDRIERLYPMAMFGGSLVQPSKITAYLDELEKLVSSLKSPSHALESQFYTQAGIMYGQVQAYDRGVKADRRLLEIIDLLEKEKHSEGRIFKNYDRNRYTIYRRMIGNYESLSKEEVTKYYRLAHELQERMPDSETESYERGLIEGLYDLAMGRYTQATAIFGQLMQYKAVANVPRYMVAYMKAARGAGDLKALADAQQRYIDLFEEQSDEVQTEAYQRMSVTMELENLEAERNRIKAEKENQQNAALARAEYDRKEYHETMLMIFGLTVLLVVIILAIAYTHSRRLGRKLAKSNEALIEERNNLRRVQDDLIKARDESVASEKRKTEFIHNVSHQIIEPIRAVTGYSELITDAMEKSDRRSYLERFVTIINNNANILQRIVNDILDVAEFDTSAPNIALNNVNLQKELELLADSARTQLSPQTTLQVNPVQVRGALPDDSGTIDTDVQRFEQVIQNLLTNAAKFTPGGSITVDAVIDRGADLLTVTVTDTGIGIPADKAEFIFERYAKLSNHTPGFGLGLNVARMVSRWLGGDTVLDTTYTGGARFVVTFSLFAHGNKRTDNEVKS